MECLDIYMQERKPDTQRIGMFHKIKEGKIELKEEILLE